MIDLFRTVLSVAGYLALLLWLAVLLAASVLWLVETWRTPATPDPVPVPSLDDELAQAEWRWPA